jgi:hypothetical protein
MKSSVGLRMMIFLMGGDVESERPGEFSHGVEVRVDWNAEGGIGSRPQEGDVGYNALLGKYGFKRCTCSCVAKRGCVAAKVTCRWAGAGVK